MVFLIKINLKRWKQLFADEKGESMLSKYFFFPCVRAAGKGAEYIWGYILRIPEIHCKSKRKTAKSQRSSANLFRTHDVFH